MRQSQRGASSLMPSSPAPFPLIGRGTSGANAGLLFQPDGVLS